MHASIGQIAMTLNRKGRKRKSGRRTPSGALARVHLDYRAMAANNPDRRGLPEALRLSEKAGSALGRLNLTKRISDEAYEAGRRYAAIVGAYLSMAGAPNGLAGAGKGYDCTGSAKCPAESCICRMRTAKYMRAYEAIPHRKAHMAINWTAIQDNHPSEDQLPHLREGLNALARHFGLIGKGRV